MKRLLYYCKISKWRFGFYPCIVRIYWTLNTKTKQQHQVASKACSAHHFVHYFDWNMEAQIFSLYFNVRIANSKLQLILMMTDYRFDDEKILIIFNETNQPTNQPSWLNEWVSKWVIEWVWVSERANEPFRMGSPFFYKANWFRDSSNKIIIFDSLYPVSTGYYPVAAYGLVLCITTDRF